MRRTLGLGSLLVALALLTGCSGGDDAAVASAARSFYTAIATHDGTAACAVLTARTRTELESSEEKPCTRAILEVPLPRDLGAPPQVRQYGVMAQVRTVADIAFLTRQGSSWRVLAAGCKPAGVTYDCELAGG